ncbi:MAG: ornithine cyclodeaminase family protein [Burkholderiaceae bacterium]
MIEFYSAEQVHAALRYDTLADAIAEQFKSNTVAPLRHAHALSATDSLLLMPAWSDGGAIGVKLVTVRPQNSERGLSTVNAVYLLFDRATGELRAMIDGEALTLRRTAAASLLAARYLARDDACVILIIGTGRLAEHLARAHCIERNVERLMNWGRSEERARALAATLREQNLPAEAVTNLEQAVGAADIISCATTATSPIVRGAWLQRGSHLDLVGAFKRGMREVDDDAVARSRVYVDTRAGAFAEAEDIIEPIERGVIEREDVRAELAELVKGAVTGRRSADEITLFKSVGTAIEDLAAAQLLIKLAG